MSKAKDEAQKKLIKENIASIRTNSAALRMQVQETAVLLLDRLPNGDCSLVPDLITAVGRGMRFDALSNYFRAMGVKISKDKKSKAIVAKLPKENRPTVIQVNEHKNIMWDSMPHDDNGMSEEGKAKRAFKSAAKYMEQFPELALEAGLTLAEKINNAEAA